MDKEVRSADWADLLSLSCANVATRRCFESLGVYVEQFWELYMLAANLAELTQANSHHNHNHNPQPNNPIPNPNHILIPCRP